jgi:hypothetical protein
MPAVSVEVTSIPSLLDGAKHHCQSVSAMKLSAVPSKSEKMSRISRLEIVSEWELR